MPIVYFPKDSRRPQSISLEKIRKNKLGLIWAKLSQARAKPDVGINWPL